MLNHFYFVSACPNGYFGLNCQDECSNNCKNDEACEPHTGFCPNGCKRGFTGDNCNQCNLFLGLQNVINVMFYNKCNVECHCKRLCHYQINIILDCVIVQPCN